MEIKIDRDLLFKSVSRVQSIIEKRSNMPILSTVLLSAADTLLTLSATDLEIGFQQSIQADVKQQGSVTLSGRKLFEILKESRKDIFHIKEKENNRVLITDGVAHFELACLPADEYPTFVEPEDISMVEVDGATLSEMITKTIYSVTAEEAGFKLSGVFTEEVSTEKGSFLRMVATDGHRLSMVDKPIPGIASLNLGEGVMIPKKGLSELNKLVSGGGPVEIGFKQKNCVARKENARLIMRLLESRFPDYHAVIPKEERSIISVERILLLDAMRKMLILSNERYRAVKVFLADNALELVSTNPELGEAREKIEVAYTGMRIEVGFNPRYFIDVLQNMESDVVLLGFIDLSKPCLVEGEADEGFLGLIMPMRL